MIRIGPAGWNYKDWAGIVYPVKRPRDFSEPGYLAQYFDTLEINTSFYGPPQPKSAARWVSSIAHNPNFRFTAKLYRAFTHERNASPEDERLVKEGMEPIAASNRLGALLLQFPISFKYTPENLEYVSRLQARFHDYALVLEVRHRSWDDEKVLDAVSELGIGMCNIDQPLIGRGLKPAAHVTSRVGYVRLHGRNYGNWFAENRSVAERYDYLYSIRELEPWAARVKAIAKHTEETYAVTNNHHVGKAVANAVELLALATNKPLKIAPEWMQHYPELKQLHAPEAESYLL